jgi:pyruvate dehydrogenase E1 component alpha subunit
MNGMNVLAVKQGFEMVREYCSSGNGPMFVELDTYRYHGHSMSDPGTTYRKREEVASVREARDPIDYVKRLLIENSLCTEDEVKGFEKEIRNHVQESLTKAKAGKFPPAEWVAEEVYATAEGKDEPQGFVRMPDLKNSFVR